MQNNRSRMSLLIGTTYSAWDIHPVSLLQFKLLPYHGACRYKPEYGEGFKNIWAHFGSRWCGAGRVSRASRSIQRARWLTCSKRWMRDGDCCSSGVNSADKKGRLGGCLMSDDPRMRVIFGFL